MNDKEKNNSESEETFEDIFSSLREKYNLEPFGSGEEKISEEEEKDVFYNPSEDKEMDDFFKEREEGYTALYEEVDAKIAGVDDDALRQEAEFFKSKFKEDAKSDTSEEETDEYEDIYSDSTPMKNELDGKAREEYVSEEKESDFQELSEEEFSEEKPKKKSSIFPKRSDSISEKIRKIVFLISIVALVLSAAWLINDYIIQPYLISKQNDEISSLIDGESSDMNEVAEKLSNLDEKEKTVTFQTLKEKNADFKAWLVVPGANINLPVVQGKDNSKYLNTGFNGKYLSGGTLFVDCYNKAPLSGDTNTVIHGHNMRDGSMFGSIKKYKDINTFKNNPLVYVYTENKNYVYKIFSVFLTSVSTGEDDGYFFEYTFKNLSTDENFLSYMQEIKLRSYYDTGVDYRAGDKIITLSTCDRTVLKEGRLVLVARLVREDETESVNTASASVNSNQKFPAGWYSKKKQKNPYENAVRWIAQ